MPNKKTRQTNTNSQKSLFSNKPTKKIIAFSLVLFPLVCFILIFSPSTLHDLPPISFDVSHDCPNDLSTSLTLQPFQENGQNVLVSLSIDGWEKSTCNKLQIIFPGETSDYIYFVDTNNSAEENIDAQPAYTRDVKEIEVQHRGSFDVIKIAPNEIENFSGGIEFTWIQGVEKLGFDEFSLLLPFGRITIEGDTSLKSIDKYDILLLLPSNYKLDSATPEVTYYKPMRGFAHYEISIEGSKFPLELNFQKRGLEYQKEIILIILSTLLGIGLTMGFELILKK